MNTIVRTVSLVLSLVLSFCWAAPCRAAENAFKGAGAFADSMYGGLSGSLVGAAVMAFANKPAENLDYMAYGAATGVMVGAAYNIGKALVVMENGKAKWPFPIVIPDVRDTNSNGKTPIVFMAEVLHGKF
jgi:ABC-type Fe3+ transport system permease subunit